MFSSVKLKFRRITFGIFCLFISFVAIWQYPEIDVAIDITYSHSNLFNIYYSSKGYKFSEGRRSENIIVNKGTNRILLTVPGSLKHLRFDFGDSWNKDNSYVIINKLIVDNKEIILNNSNYNNYHNIKIVGNKIYIIGDDPYLILNNTFTSKLIYIKLIIAVIFGILGFRHFDKILNYFRRIIYQKRVVSTLQHIKNHSIEYYCLLLLIAYNAVKIFANKDIIGSFMFEGNKILGIYTLLKFDLWVSVCLIILLTINVLIDNKIFRNIIGLLSVSLIVLYVLDIMIKDTFSTRLVFSDIFKFAGDITNSYEIIINIIKRPIFILCVLLVVLSIYIIKHNLNKHLNAKSSIRFLLIELLALIISLIMYNSNFGYIVYEDRFYNLFQVNCTTENNKYSSMLKKSVSSPHYKYLGNDDKNRNVILLIVESFSSSSSNFISGCENYTPNLDRRASNAIVFKNYFSNGACTDNSLFTIFTGHPYIPGWVDIANPKFYKYSFVNQLKNRGYRTEFYYPTKNVGWLDSVLKNLHFDLISRDNDSNYPDTMRYVFNSVDDSILLNYVGNNIKDKEKYLAVIVTAGMHSPFTDPATKRNNSYGAATMFTDNAICAFIDKLDRKNFFDNGILIITGDHHAMLPLTKDEIFRYGKNAKARVPLLIFDKSQNKKILDKNFDHSGLGCLIEYLATGSYNINQYQIDPIDFNQKPILFYPIVPVDSVYVINGEKFQTIKLDGDNTKFIDNTSVTDEQNEILKYIIWLREDV